jgi:lysophospholipase L1-like esterase
LAVVWVVLVALVSGSPALAHAKGSSPPLPKSMAAIGDSITQAADACCWYGDHPESSWSTGWAPLDGVDSHYERLLRLNPKIAGENYNDSVSGSKMADAPAQAQRAVSQRVHYVTMLMGANDLCTPSLETMTPVDTFRAQVRQTLEILASGLSGRARIFVASIPDVHRLWDIYHQDPRAQLVWDLADICQSLLSPERTDEQRQQVRERNIAFNAVLEQECAAYARCRFDGNALFNYPFSTSQVSELDYFHPNLAGQSEIARITFERGWWS